jgi:hypothetical protein
MRFSSLSGLVILALFINSSAAHFSRGLSISKALSLQNEIKFVQPKDGETNVLPVSPGYLGPIIFVGFKKNLNIVKTDSTIFEVTDASGQKIKGAITTGKRAISFTPAKGELKSGSSYAVKLSKISYSNGCKLTGVAVWKFTMAATDKK